MKEPKLTTLQDIAHRKEQVLDKIILQERTVTDTFKHVCNPFRLSFALAGKVVTGIKTLRKYYHYFKKKKQ